MSEAIKNKFAEMTIYGHKFTAHHNSQLLWIIRETVTEFLNWLHCNGYLPVPHKPYQIRTWYKDMDGKKYSETDLFFKFIKHIDKEFINQKIAEK